MIKWIKDKIDRVQFKRFKRDLEKGKFQLKATIDVVSSDQDGRLDLVVGPNNQILGIEKAVLPPERSPEELKKLRQESKLILSNQNYDEDDLLIEEEPDRARIIRNQHYLELRNK